MKKRLFKIILPLAAVVLFVFGDMSYLCAQEADVEEFTLDEITVTAQKRAENQQKVAIPMEVIAGEDLKKLGKNSIDDILANVSNIIVNKSADGLRISLRGYSDSTGTNHGQSTSSPAVAVNMDGVYSSRKDTGAALFDLERVEVLFGPQSTMYSSNSPGGIVNVETASPKLNEYEASGTLEYGNFNLLHTEGVVNVPVNDMLALRGAFQTKVHDGYISNGGDDEDIKSGRVKALLEPTSKLTFTITGETAKSTTHRSGSSVTGFVDQSDVPDPWTSTQTIGNPDHNTTKKIYGRIDWDMGFGSLSLVPSYSDRSGDRDELMIFGADYNHWLYTTKGNEKSIEIRMASSAGSFFEWLVGFNYFKSNDWLTGLSYDESGNVKTGIDHWTQTTVEVYRHSGGLEDAKAAFANVTYPVTDRFRGTGGVRMSWDKYTFINNEVRGWGGGELEEVHQINAMDYSEPDYKIGVEYDLGENSMLYADYSTSYRVQSFGGGRPGATPGSTTEEEYPPETIKAYTIGSKNRFLGNKLELNAAAFYYDYENFAAGDMVMGYYGPLNPDGSIDLESFDSDAIMPDPGASTYGDGRWYGLDLQSSAIIGQDDRVNLSLSYLHSEWTDLAFDYYYPYRVGGMAMPGQSITPDMLEPATTVSYNGKPMTMSPELTVNVTYLHNFNLPNGAFIEGRLDTEYQSAYRLSWKEVDYPYNYQESFYNADLAATYYNADGKWNLSMYVKNLRNYAEKRSYFGAPANELRIGSPRTYGAVLSVRF